MIRRPRLPVLADHDANLAETLRVLNKRRRMLKMIGGMGAFALVSKNVLACTLIPEETAGPYPGDGSNGPNVLNQSGIVRSDIRSSFGASGTNTAAGTLANVTLQLVSTTSGCAQLEGLAVYLWHCNATGGYSMYSSGITGENYLRGVQVTDANGQVTFTSIYPGCYSGRWPHMHFEIFKSRAAATVGTKALLTSQLAMPSAIASGVYNNASGYSASVANFKNVSLADDLVFGDDTVAQLTAMTPKMSGSVAAGYVATATIGIAV